MDWHHEPIKAVLGSLHASVSGLSSRDAARRLKRAGPNRLAPPATDTALLRILRQFQSPLVLVLLATAVLTAYLRELVDTVVILIVVIVNAAVGYWQEHKASHALAALKSLLAPQATVLRDGTPALVNADRIVAGDVILLEPGQRVPADCRLVDSDGLTVDESVLTGESLPVPKQVGTVARSAPTADQRSMVFAGTLVGSGRATGLVVATGAETALGRIASTTLSTPELMSPLHRRLGVLTQVVLAVILSSAAFIVLVGLARGGEPLDLVLTAVATAVAAIPEGLPAVVTITLAIGLNRMAKSRALTRQLTAVETLGSVTVIATDKTGTLTRNELMVTHIVTSPGETYRVSGDGYRPRGAIRDPLGRRLRQPGRSALLRPLLEVGRCANAATLVESTTASDGWQIIGDPVDGALLVLAEKAGLSVVDIERLDELPFTSHRRFMAMLSAGEAGRTELAVKGAPETIIARSTHCAAGRLTEARRQAFLADAHRLSAQGLRVLALARRSLPTPRRLQASHVTNLKLLGLVGMQDPARPDVVRALGLVARSGIRVVMITGDHAATAQAVAAEIGLGGRHQPTVIEEQDLLARTLPEFHQAVATVDVFARITPDTKLRIVESLQRGGAIVAVTGDGVNDAPILKRADVGVAMGIGGTDVARETADVVLLDNNFASLPRAIEEGRTIFNNIRRVVFYLLSTNAAEVALVVGAIALGTPLPLLPAQILWINLVTDGTNDIALAFEPPHRAVARQRPRPPTEAIINAPIAWRIAVLALVMAVASGLVFAATYQRTGSLDHARTLTFVTLAFMQITNALNARSLTLPLFALPLAGNPWLVASLGLSVLLTILPVVVPLFTPYFHATPLALGEWGMALALSLGILAVGEMLKRAFPVIQSMEAAHVH